MAFGKTEEEKARRQAEKEAAREAARRQAEEAQQRAAAAKARAAYLKTPVGQADEARERGDMFFQFHAPLSQLQGRATDWTYGATPGQPHTGQRIRSARSRSLAGGSSISPRSLSKPRRTRAARCSQAARSPAPAATSKASTCSGARRPHKRLRRSVSCHHEL